MQKILLNYLPPSDIYTPSASLSILKSFMQENGFTTNVKYWNLLFRNILPFPESQETEEAILPFLSILNDQYDNTDGNKNILSFLKENYTDQGKEDVFYKNLLEESKTNIKDIISNEILHTNFNEILLFGISSKFHQWIPGIILSQEVKKKSPTTKIIAGGFGSKESAIEAMRLNPNFDYATWGEGEYPLLELAKQLQNGTNYYDMVPRLVFRRQGKIIVSPIIGSKYLDMENYLFPDFDDYFDAYPEPDKKYKIVIPLNSSRACSWNKCKFCDYNKGYKYRARDPQCIVNETEFIAKKYEVACFSFVDNDVFVNPEHFEPLLDLIIESKNRNNFNYEFWAEMIPNDKINAGIMRKMQTAGFTQIFIGYDGISDSLLKKMAKSNSFSSNLLFVKFALKYDIYPLVNIIKGIPDESKEDVLESMNNLHFLRFLFNRGEESLYHEYVTLVVSNMTKYYIKLSKEEKQKYNFNKLTELLPPFFYNHNDRFSLFRWQKPTIDNAKQWEDLLKKENHYTNNKYSYRIVFENGNRIYKEYFNKKEIISLEFEEKEYWDILEFTNEKIYTFNELHEKIKNTNSELSIQKMQFILGELKAKHLIYCNKNFSDIISVI